jgi:hypothetical protein
MRHLTNPRFRRKRPRRNLNGIPRGARKRLYLAIAVQPAELGRSIAGGVKRSKARPAADWPRPVEQAIDLRFGQALAKLGEARHPLRTVRAHPATIARPCADT